MFSERELEILADRMVEKSLRRVLETIGYDISSPETRKEIRDDHDWVRSWRKGSRTAGFAAAGTAITTFIGGAIWLILAGLKAFVKTVT